MMSTVGLGGVHNLRPLSRGSGKTNETLDILPYIVYRRDQTPTDPGFSALALHLAVRHSAGSQ